MYHNLSIVNESLKNNSNNIKNKIKSCYINNIFDISKNEYSNDDIYLYIDKINQYIDDYHNTQKLSYKIIENYRKNDILIGVYSDVDTHYKLCIGGQIICEKDIKKNTFQYLINEDHYLYYNLLIYHNILIYTTHPNNFYIINGKFKKSIDQCLTTQNKIYYDIDNKYRLSFCVGMVLKQSNNQ